MTNNREALLALNKTEDLLTAAMKSYHNSQQWYEECAGGLDEGPTIMEAIDASFNQVRDALAALATQQPEAGEAAPYGWCLPTGHGAGFVLGPTPPQCLMQDLWKPLYAAPKADSIATAEYLERNP